MSEPVVREEQINEVPFIPMIPRELLRTLMIGVIVGIGSGVVYMLLEKFVFGTVLCRPQSTGDCSQAPTYAAIVAAVIGLIAGVASLARARIYRPLLIVLASLISLWGIHTVLATWPWYLGLIAFAVLSGLTYLLYTWIARIRNFILAIVVIVVIVVIVRWIFVS